MNATHSAIRWRRTAAALGVLLIAAGCASQPSLGPKTETGQPAHVDGGPGQLMRYCETLHDRGKLPMAAAMCERAYQLDPTNPEPLLELAGILEDMGELESARRAYEVVLADRPDHADAHYGLGRLHMNSSQYDLALAEFQAGLRSDPNNPRLYNAAGVASGMLGAHAAAQEVFRAGLKVAPDDIRLRNNLGLSLIQTGHYDDGLKLLRTVATDPAAEKANVENLDLALGVATAARAEAALAENRARLAAEAMAQAEAQDQGVPEGEPAPIAAEATAPAGDAGEVYDEPAPAEGLAEATTAQPEAPEAADETMHAEVAEPTSLLSEPIAKSDAAEATPPGRAKDAADAPLPVIQSWRQRARADIAGLSDSDDGTWPAAGRTSADQNAATEAADAAVPADAAPIEETAGLSAEEIVDDRLAVDETMAEATDDGAAEPAEQVAALPDAPAPAISGDHAVQFASYTSEDRAWHGWSVLQQEAADILSNVEATVRKAELGDAHGVVYRLRSSPGPKAAAERLCNDLKPRGIACLVVKTEAQPSTKDAPKGAATL